MMVAIDTSFAAQVALTSSGNTAGISRAVLELCWELHQREDLDLRCVGWSGADAVSADVRVRRWCRLHDLPEDPVRIRRIGSSSLYERLVAAIDADGRTSTASRTMLKFLKVADTKQVTRTQDLHVFHSTFSAFPASVEARKVARILTIYDLIPFTDPTATTDVQRYILRDALNSADDDRDVFITISEFVKQELCEHWSVPSDRVTVARLAASSIFRPSTLGTSPRRRPYILSVASVQPRKNVDLLVRAFAQLNDPLLDLLLTGHDGWLGDSTEELLNKDADLRKRVHRLGFVSDEELATLYSEALIFAFPSRSEGFGLPVLEAMQSGTPTIVAASAALPEIVGDAAVLVPVNDVDALAGALWELSADERLRKRLSAAGVERAKLFSWTACAGATFDAYRAALSLRS